jgi:hypothetical protein
MKASASSDQGVVYDSVVTRCASFIEISALDVNVIDTEDKLSKT